MAQSRIDQFLDKIAAQLKSSSKGELPTRDVFTQELQTIFQQLKSAPLRAALLGKFDHYSDMLWNKYSSSFAGTTTNLLVTNENSTTSDPTIFFNSLAFDLFLKRPRSGDEYRSVLAVPGCPTTVKESFVQNCVLDGKNKEADSRSLSLIRPFGTFQEPKMLTKELELLASYYARIPPASSNVAVIGAQLARFHLIRSSWPSGVPRKVQTEYSRRVASLLGESVRCGCVDPEAFRPKVAMFGEQARSLLQFGSDPGGLLELIGVLIHTRSSSSSALTLSSSSSSSSSRTLLSSSSSSSSVEIEIIRNLLNGLESLLANFEPRHSFRLALFAAESTGEVAGAFSDLRKNLKLTDLPKECITTLTRIGQNEQYYSDLFAVSPGMLKLALAQSLEEDVIPFAEKEAESFAEGDTEFFVDTAGDQHVRGILNKKQRT